MGAAFIVRHVAQLNCWMSSASLPHALGLWGGTFPKAQQVKEKQTSLLEFQIFLTIGQYLCDLSIPQSTLGSISECLQLRLFAAVQMGQELPISSLSSSCSAMSSKALVFCLMPDRLVAFKEIPICCAVVHKNNKIKILKKLIASFPKKAKDAKGVRQQDPEKETVQLKTLFVNFLISELALNSLLFCKGDIKPSHQTNAQTPIHVIIEPPAGVAAAWFMNLSDLQSSRNAFHLFLSACAYLLVLVLLTLPFIIPCKVFLTKYQVGYCLHWNIYVFSCRSETSVVHNVNWRL